MLVGLLMLGFLWTTARSGPTGLHRRRVRNATLYWHFVDAVWLCVFTVLYLAPHLSH